MPSGYDKSPDYGGPELNLWLLVLVLVALIFAKMLWG
jgi:hypothetical protein